ncbi:MAG TPA: amidase [Phycisphaerales bacterium]|nr:amidase [Phycisphaerales bacterium]
MIPTGYSRRDFILSSAVALTTLHIAAAQQTQSSSAAPSPDIGPQPDSASGPAIDPHIIEDAERLAGITFTPAERQMMSHTIAEQVQMIRSRQKVSAFPNSLSPMFTFDPRLPGMSFSKPEFAPEWSQKDPGPIPTDDVDIAFAPLTSLSYWLRTRQISSERLTRIYLDRLKTIGPKLEAVITLTEDLAMGQARNADREIQGSRWRGPLHGVPWGAKDLLDTAGIATTWGAEPYRNRVPDQDASVVTLLANAGAVLVAKLSLGALAYDNIWFGGKTRNPWNLRQGPSGSSAGPAAATAAGLVGFSIGSETLGSIVSPCMRCGTTGLRPTFGRVSRGGAMALSWTMDKLGPITRTVEDAMMVLSAINNTARDPRDPASLAVPLRFRASTSARGLRVGYDPAWFKSDPANDLDRATLAQLSRTGVNLSEIELPDWPYDALLTILFCEAAAAFEDLTRTNLDDSLTWQEPQAWPNTFRQSWFIPGIELIQAFRFRRQVCQMMADLFSAYKIDAIIAPSFAASLLTITNNTGHPSLTLRTGFLQDSSDEPETPHGITLIGNLFDEATLCRIGMELEHQLQVWNRRPSLV